jgi:two-component system LytT family response regulator
MRILTLIVDDEAPARARIRRLLKDEPDFEIVGECANGRQAITAIQKHRPGLVFLDVQMPRLGGVEVCAGLAGESRPLIIFVTAYDQYALQAFEVHAIDYLLKPFDRERFQKSLQHVRERLQRNTEAPVDTRLAALLEDLRPGTKKLERLAFKTNGRIVFVRVAEIDWIEADGNYVHLRVGGRSHHLRETLSWLEGQLPPEKFMRLSRSVIVNLDRIREFQPLFYGDYTVILQDGTKLTLSRNFRDRLENLLKHPR